jgi:hypothetical protein
MQGPEKNLQKYVTFFSKKKDLKKCAGRNLHNRSLSVQTGCDPQPTLSRQSGNHYLDRRSPGLGDPWSATAPTWVPHYVDPLSPLPNFLAHKILHVWSTLRHWLQHMPSLPRLLLETSNIYNF